MRFDDSLRTVLAADTSTAFGAQSAFRQLVDLLGRRRIATEPALIERLRALRPHVPANVRGAAARALALAVPEAPLVGFFAEDDPPIAAPVLRGVTLTASDWADLLPRIGPSGRAILRQRKDLPADVVRALESFGTVDFTLPAPTPPPPALAAGDVVGSEVAEIAPPMETFVTLGEVARRLPVVESALSQPDPAEQTPSSRFEISDLVARIAAYQQQRSSTAAGAAPPKTVEFFEFETDVAGIVTWVGGGVRGALIGLSLADPADADGQGVDAAVAGALRARRGFNDGRLLLTGLSVMAGPWRVSGAPCFDELSGRFTGYRGRARRPRADESIEPYRVRDPEASEALRRLVHELRTPTNAIAGFSELIHTQLMGPVAEPYRTRAQTMLGLAQELVSAIEDLDYAARITGDALELRPGRIPVRGLLDDASRDLAPLAELRGARIEIAPVDPELMFRGDDRAIERLVTRLMTATLSAAAPGDRVMIGAAREGDTIVAIFSRPAALAGFGTADLLAIDAESEAALPGAPLLGTGFALRLAHGLATELGGALLLGEDRLTLRLPAVLDEQVERISNL